MDAVLHQPGDLPEREALQGEGVAGQPDWGPSANRGAGVTGAQLQLGVEAPAPRPPREPTPEQARAIEARDRDVLLEAGAGTGKTLVLVERYCEAAEEGAGIAEILAFK